MPLWIATTEHALPTKSNDAVSQMVRINTYGEEFVTGVVGGYSQMVREGAYFKAINPTFNTAIAWNAATATAFNELQGSLCIRNSHPDGGPHIILDYIRFQLVTAGTAATNINCVIQVDNSIRHSNPAATNIMQIFNVNSGQETDSGAICTIGALGFNGALTSKKLSTHAFAMKTTAPAINDVFFLNFGPVRSNAGIAGTTYARDCGMVALPPGGYHSFLMHIFSTSQTAAPTVFCEIGFFER